MDSQRFKIADGNCEESQEELSSLFLKNYFYKKGDRAKVILLYPVSLVFNSSLVSERSKIDERCKQEIENIWNNENGYLENPCYFFNNHFPYAAQKDGLKVIHSIGSYIYGKSREDTKEIQFDSSYSDIVLEIFLDMLERYLNEEEPVSEVYVDISSGHNIYVSALLEALRHFSTFTSLSCWFDKNQRPKLYVTICDPILPGNNNIYNIYIENQRFVVFFETPIKLSDIKNIERKISAEFTEDLKDVLKRFLLIFSAIKNNVPLYLFDRFTVLDSLKAVKELLVNIIDYLKSKIISNYKSSPKLDKNLWVKIINALGFYIGIIESMKAFEIYPYTSKEGINVNEIREKIKKLYQKFGLTGGLYILEVELDKLGQQKGNSIGERTKASRFEKEVKRQRAKTELSKYPNNRNRLQRNFFAHCGLEENFVEVEEKNNDVYVKYFDDIPKIRDIIKEFLLNRV